MTCLRTFPLSAVALTKEDAAWAARIFCSMKITEDICNQAAEERLAEEQALDCGLQAEGREFAEKGVAIFAKT